MRWKEIKEASIPFGKPVDMTGFTFGFEAEMFISSSELGREFDYYGIDEDDICDEFGCDPETFNQEFSNWKEEQDDDDLTVHEWIDDIGEENWWQLVKADGNYTYGLRDGTIVQTQYWHDSMMEIAELISDEIGELPKVAHDDETPIENKNYQNWYIEGDLSIHGESELDYGFEVISPVFHSYNDYIENMKKCFHMLFNVLGAKTNNTTGFHINIGAESKNIDPLKLLLFSGEKWMANDWGRGDNEHVESIISQISPLPKSIADANAVVRNFMDRDFEKHWVVNIRTLIERGYVEFRAAGGSGYQNNIDKIIRDTNRYIQLIQIASSPDKYKQEYMKKIAALKNDYLEKYLPFDEKQVKIWADGLNISDNDRKSIFDNNKLVIDANFLFVILYNLEKEKIPDIIARILINKVGKDAIKEEIRNKYGYFSDEEKIKVIEKINNYMKWDLAA